MKRFILGLVTSAVLLGVAASAYAAGPYTYKDGGLLQWRTHKSTIVGNEGWNYGADASGGFIDSTSFYVPNAADGQDTTDVWGYPKDMAFAAASDSLPLVVLEVQNTVAGAAGDSLHLGIEPWLRGTNFLATTAFPAATNRVLTGAITGGYLQLFPALPAGAYAGSETAASTNPVTRIIYPALGVVHGFRVRSYGDGTAAFTGGGRVTVRVWYLSTINSAN